MYDHVGNVVGVGDFVSFGGAGNRKVEYGLITGRVVSIDEQMHRVGIVRLHARYRPNVISRRKSTKECGKFIKLFMTPAVLDVWFDEKYEFKITDFTPIAGWIHRGTW